MWLAAGLLLAVMAGAVAFITMQRTLSAYAKPVEEPKAPVLVAARDIPLQTVIAAGDVRVRQVPPDMIPPDALTDPQGAVGQLTTADIANGEIILRRRLIAPDYVGPKAAFVMDPKQVVVAFPASDLLTSIGIVRPGDHVDLMLTYDFGKNVTGAAPMINTLTVLQDLRIAALITGPGQGGQPGPPVAILLALDPQDALMLKYLRDAGAAADLALRSPAAKGLFDVVPVDGQYILRKFQVRWEAKQ